MIRTAKDGCKPEGPFPQFAYEAPPKPYRDTIPDHMLQRAVQIAHRRMQYVRKGTAMDYSAREESKKLAWDELHNRRVTEWPIADILTSWGHREVAQGFRRPKQSTLMQWAIGIASTVQKAWRVLER